MSTKRNQLAISVIAALTVMTGTQAVAQVEYGAYGEETALTLAREHAGRYTGSEKEVKAAEYMKERMTVAGSNNAAEMREFSFVAPRGLFRGETLKSNNVVVTQKGVTDKTLYVGGHYDSAVAYSGYEALEALDDNASGAGVITELVQNLSGIQGEHNVEFIGFGAEEGGLNGSKAFAAALTDEQKANALGMVNLDSLITGDKMYANAGRNAYDADGKEVAANVGLRENALRIAKDMGINLQTNPAIIPEGQDKPYKPAGVGCCSDQESFDKFMPVVGFEATDWEAGEEKDGYTQTSNPAIPDGYTWHNPDLDNEKVLTEAFGKERISQRMADYSRIVSRLVVEQTNADIIASGVSAISLQNNINKQLSSAATASHSAVFERANAVALGGLDDSKQTNVWVDGSTSYVDTDNVESGYRADLGIYAEHTVQPNWRIGAGIQGSKQNNDQPDNGIKKDDSYGATIYSLAGDKSSKWWNTTALNYAKHDLDANRTVRIDGNNGINIINNNHRGDVDADVFSAQNELGYNFSIQDKMIHGAFLGLDYAKVDIDGYTSGDAGSRTALAISDTSADNFEAELGYQMQYNFNMKEMPAKLLGKLSYVHVIEDGQIDNLSALALADNQVRDITINGADKDESFGRFSLGINSAVAKNVNAYLDGETTFGHDDKDLAVRVGLQYQF